MKARRAAILLVLAATAAVAVHPAGAASIRWLRIDLGTHRFGHLTRPDAVVARAGKSVVGFECGKPSMCPGQQPSEPREGCGCIDTIAQGPTGLDVAADGTVWVVDGVKHRLLAWRRGHTAAPARAVRLPANVRDSDVAVGRDGTFYVLGENVSHRPYLWLYALTGKGAIRWKEQTTVGSSQARLLIAPDGSLFAAGPSATPTWTPLTTTTGRPLSLSAQRARSGPLQPLAGGLRLSTTVLSPHEVHFALVDSAHRVLRAWRVTSRTTIGTEHISASLIGGDLVVALAVTRDGTPFRWEDVVLRLTVDGGIRSRLVLNPRAVWDPDGSMARTTTRIAPDGRLYQLRTDPAKGLTVARYSL
jgi:hypothetical protein